MAKPLQHQIVARALELISDEAHWTRGFVARRADGSLCASSDLRAAQFCAVGALNRAAHELVKVGRAEHAYAAEGLVSANRPPGWRVGRQFSPGLAPLFTPPA